MISIFRAAIIWRWFQSTIQFETKIDPSKARLFFDCLLKSNVKISFGFNCQSHRNFGSFEAGNLSIDEIFFIIEWVSLSHIHHSYRNNLVAATKYYEYLQKCIECASKFVFILSTTKHHKRVRIKDERKTKLFVVFHLAERLFSQWIDRSKLLCFVSCFLGNAVFVLLFSICIWRHRQGNDEDWINFVMRSIQFHSKHEYRISLLMKTD